MTGLTTRQAQNSVEDDISPLSPCIDMNIEPHFWCVRVTLSREVEGGVVAHT